MKRMIRFGIMGCGAISARFCGSIVNEEEIKIQRVAARDVKRAEAFSEKFGAKRYGDYNELLNDADVDIIYIGTVHTCHFEHIRLCLSHGKHVLCEKPLALSGAEARASIKLAEEKKLLLMEGMWTRCNPCVIRATEWVREGRIGDVRLITANFCFNEPYNPDSRLYDPRTAGGAIYDVGVYTIELSSGILGEYPTDVKALSTLAPTGVDACSCIVLGFPSGALASLTCAVNVKSRDDCYIYGSDGHIFIREFWGARDAYLYDANGKEIETAHDELGASFCHEARHAADLVKRGALESDLIPHADTISCADIFDKILKPV